MNKNKESDSQLLSSEMSEITFETLESILESDVFKSIPILREILGAFKVTNDISNYLFLKKILTFLNGIKDVSEKERAELIDKIDRSKKYRIKVGEKLLYIIDKSSDHEVVEYIAFLFAAYLRGEIDYVDFLKGSTILNNISIDDFKEFLKIESLKHLDEVDYNEYSSARLLYLYTEQPTLEPNDEPERYEAYIIRGGDLKAEFTEIGLILKRVFSNHK